MFHMPGNQNVPSIIIPPLQLAVFSVESMPTPVRLVQQTSTCLRPDLSNFTKQMLNMDQSPSITNTYNVPLLSEQILCVSCLYPSAITVSCLSQQVGNATVLPEQTCNLNKTKNNILFLAPAMQIKVLFRSTAVPQLPNAETNGNNDMHTADSVQTLENSTEQITHLFTVSLPLKYVLQQLMNSETIVHNVMTSEDDNKVWRLELTPAATMNVSAQTLQEHYSMQIDTVTAHEAWVKSEMGYCESLLETASFVTKERMARKESCSTVLKKLVPGDELPTSWDLQMSRPLGVAITPSGAQPMKTDQQALEYMRRGSATGDQAQQTFLMFVNSLASATVQIAQQAGVHIGFDPSTQLAIFDPVAFQNANQNFVAHCGANALMEIVQLKCQENVFASTQYTSDPKYNTVMQMRDARVNNNGSGRIDFQSQIVKSDVPGEDQQIGVGYGLENNAGLLKTDCEDVAALEVALSSQMLAFPKAEFLQSTAHALSYFPTSVQQISNTIVSMAEVLHTQENQNMQHANHPQTKKVSLENLNMNVLRNAIAQAKDAPAVRIVSACSLLAKAPSIGQDTGTSVGIRDKTLASSEITPASLFEWWGTSRENGLNGHSVCTAINARHVLSTHVDGKPVFVTLVLPQQQIFEGTGVARETSTPASQVDTLNLATDASTLTPQRVLLMQKLNSGIILNTALASNIKSALNAAEVTKIMANTAVKAKTTSAPMGVSMQQTRTQVPTVAAIQAYSLTAGECATVAQRELTIQTMFYAVGLSCGLGPFYSIPMQHDKHDKMQRDQMHTDKTLQISNLQSMSPMSDDNTSQAIKNMQIIPGIPFTRDLIPESTFARVVVSAPCSPAEAQRLKTLGAYMALGKLSADLYMKRCQASFMPLHLRQSMILCPLNNCLTPLSAAQMQNTTSFKCGVVSKSPYLAPKTGAKYETTAEIEANMHAIYTNLCNVIHCLPVVTGTGFSDAMMIVYP